MEAVGHNIRRHVRRSVVQPAAIRELGGPRSYHCIIRDFSEGGAKLRVPLDFPKEGKFILTAREIGIDCAVKIVWRAEHSIGVSFDHDRGMD